MSGDGTVVEMQLDSIDDECIDKIKEYGADIIYVHDEFNKVSATVTKGVYQKLLEYNRVKKIVFAKKMCLW